MPDERVRDNLDRLRRAAAAEGLAGTGCDRQPAAVSRSHSLSHCQTGVTHKQLQSHIRLQGSLEQLQKRPRVLQGSDALGNSLPCLPLCAARGPNQYMMVCADKAVQASIDGIRVSFDVLQHKPIDTEQTPAATRCIHRLGA